MNNTTIGDEVISMFEEANEEFLALNTETRTTDGILVPDFSSSIEEREGLATAAEEELDPEILSHLAVEL